MIIEKYQILTEIMFFCSIYCTVKKHKFSSVFCYILKYESLLIHSNQIYQNNISNKDLIIQIQFYIMYAVFKGLGYLIEKIIVEEYFRCDFVFLLGGKSSFQLRKFSFFIILKV